MAHPNATISGGTVGLGTIIVWLLGYLHVPLSAEEGALIAGGASTVILWIGRNGIRGAWRRLFDGPASPTKP